ncbi:MAG: glycerophosphodiester phosphodiesterase [Candidatus Lokiarchaeota archaeon]|nr:glycerophosphodiester phosphodiesterase [Candidatus Lokiarchaeota archaeon]
MKQIKDEIIIIAHRGASNIAPENTLKAFKKAIELKADFIEFDVLETKDGKIVVCHDEEISKLTGQHGFIRELTLQELKTFDFGEGEKIPSFEELIEVTKGKINLNCEVIVKGISNKVIKILKKYDLTDSVIISSFKREELLRFQKIDPTVKLAYLDHNNYEMPCSWDKKEEWIQFCIDNQLYAINPFYPLVNQQFVDLAHSNNIKVFPFTVDSGPAMRKLIKFGVDGIITNDVEKVRELLNRKK